MALPIDMPTPAPGDLQHESEVARDPRAFLPPEIWLCIFEKLTTVEELWALARSSKKQWYVFERHDVQILEKVLEDDTHPCMRNVIHATFNLLARDSRDWTRLELQHIDSFASAQSLSRKVTHEFVRNFVNLARKIHVIADMAFENWIRLKQWEWWNQWIQWNLSGPRYSLGPNSFGTGFPGLHPCTLVNETQLMVGLWLCQLYDVLQKTCGEDDLPWMQRPKIAIPSDELVYDLFGKEWLVTLITVMAELHIMGYDLSVWEEPCVKRKKTANYWQAEAPQG